MIVEEFESFLIANEKRIYHYLLTLLSNEADAQDVLQDTFIAFYEHINAIEKTTSVSYLYRIAHNKALSFKKKSKRVTLHPPEDFDNLPDTSNHIQQADYTLLHNAMADLPVKLSSVIHLQYYENLSYKEIADKLGFSVKAIESLIVRAKKILRKKLLQERKS